MWIVPQSILSDFVRASECSTSELQPHLNNSDSSRTLRPCVNGKPTPRPFSWKGWKSRPWSRALFGAAISATSMESRFAEWWTSSLRDSHASRTASPESNLDSPTVEATEKTAKDRFRNSCESFPSVDPPWFSAKTFLPGFFADISDLSERNYREWVTRSKARSLSLRNRLARVTKGSECSSWHTPQAATLDSLTCSGDGREKPNKLAWKVTMWPTPTANDDNKTPEAHLAMKIRMGERDGTNSNRAAITSLNVMTKAWSTPKAAERSSQSPKATPKGFQPTLLDQASNWHTPRANDSEKRGECAEDHRNGLIGQIVKWTTPMATDSESAGGKNQSSLTNAATGRYSLPDQTPTGEKYRRKHGRRLNPAFVCWLMGLPWWWTHPEPINFAAVAMDAYRSKLRSLLSSYFSVP